MPQAKVCLRWGEAKFNESKFKAGLEADRAAVACDLLKRQSQFVGKDRSEIRNTLGDPDGFYFSEIFPAYMIETAKSDSGDSWQIVFLLDRKEKVNEIVVHKNCCEK